MLDDASFVPGGRKYGGMDAFAALCAPAEMSLVGEPPPSELMKSAYLAAGKADSLRHLAVLDRELTEELFDWFCN